MRRSFGKRVATCVLALAAIGSAASCKPPPFRAKHATWFVGTVTRSGLDRYEFADQGSGLKVTAPTSNRGGNLRLASVKQGTPTSLNQESCVTWNGPVASLVQPGVVLRAKLDANRTRAILVTNNILFGVRSTINVHVADTAKSSPYERIISFNMTGGLGHFQRLNPLPWRLCARAAGSTVTVKAWSITAHPAEPSWTDPTYTASVQVPANGVYAGKPGVFIGHLKAGRTTTLSDHATRTN